MFQVPSWPNKTCCDIATDSCNRCFSSWTMDVNQNSKNHWTNLRRTFLLRGTRLTLNWCDQSKAGWTSWKTWSEGPMSNVKRIHLHTNTWSHIIPLIDKSFLIIFGKNSIGSAWLGWYTIGAHSWRWRCIWFFVIIREFRNVWFFYMSCSHRWWNRTFGRSKGCPRPCSCIFFEDCTR